jgi:DNA replication protein DnaC
MVTRWQIVKSTEKERYLLFFDGTKQDLGFIYQKITPLVESARYAEKPYNYCFFLKSIDASAIDKLKKIMSLLTDITKETTKPHDFQPQEQDDFFGKLQKGILSLTKLKSEKYKGENEIKNPKDLGIEIEKTASWQVVSDNIKKPQIKSEDFFNKLQNQLADLGKSKLKKVTPADTKDISGKSFPETDKKSALDFGILEEFLAKPPSHSDKEIPEPGKPEEKIPKVEKAEPAKKTEKKQEQETQKTGKAPPAEPAAASAKIGVPARFEFTNSKNFKLSPFAPINPLQNFETLLVTSGNRNSHAASVSVSQNPGEYENPFAIIGGKDSGKTHFINAIYNTMQKQLECEKIFFTTGIRLSKIITMPSKDMVLLTLGKKLEDFEAVLIDNIEHMFVTNSNKTLLAEMFENFLKEKKQIVFTSALSREKLENALAQKGVKIPSFLSVELKSPASEERMDILKVHIKNFGFSDVEADEWIKNMQYNMSFKDARRLWVLKNMMTDFPQDSLEILRLVKDAENNFLGLTQSELGKVSLFKLPDANNWGRWGIFYHKGVCFV